MSLQSVTRVLTEQSRRVQALTAAVTRAASAVEQADLHQKVVRLVGTPLDWDRFDREVRERWRRELAPFEANPRTAGNFARPDDPRLIGGGTLRPRDWLALALILGSR